MSQIHKLPIGDLKDYNFAIPRSYQRGYRWRADNEVKKLLKDINESETDYSLQPLILCEKDKDNKLYDVVDGQQRLTTILLILGDTKQFENFSHDEIDKNNIKNAKDQIACFMSSLTKEEKTSFMDKVRKSFFISYIVEGDEDEVRKIFTRVNEGKIPLSSAELLKAWFFTSLPYKDVRDKWNEMEKLLEDDFFFCFINPEPESPRYYATRMDYLAELVEIIISGDKKDRRTVENNWEKDKNYVFSSLSERYSAKEVFEKLYSLFTTLKSCYDDIDTYNRIGFLINRKNRPDQYEFLVALDNKDLNLEIKCVVGDLESFEQLNYYDNHDRIENILLLFNLTFYKNIDSRFDFKTYQEVRRNSGWTLDHIHAKNEVQLNEKELKELEEQIKQIDCTLLQKAKEKYMSELNQFEYQNLLYDLRDQAQEFDKKTGNFVSSDATIEKWINGIGNLVLLEHKQNSSFSNASVKEKLGKLDKIKDSDERRKLFKGTLFAYGRAKVRELWLKNECDIYLEEIKERIKTFLDESIEKNSYVDNCRIDFLSNQTKDYGMTVDGSFFRNNEPVSLMDIIRKCKIVIPDFQREYAQGRCDKHSEFVREMFLNDIFRFLKDESKKKMELDFIYGRINDRNEFFPFDGQQRLTTLFLVYAELYREKRMNAEFLLENFKYADRPEAEAYCVSCIRSNEDKNESSNPSVKGMQEMRNAIREKIQGLSLSEKEIEKLNSIVFYIPSDISLSTDIYWKMNSRGKRLTPLERFKSSWFGKGEEEQAKSIDAIAVKFFKDNHEKYEDNFMAIISIMFDGFSMIENKRSGKREKINFYEPDLIPSSAYVAFKALSDDGYVKVLEKLFSAMGNEIFDLKIYQNNFVDACPAYTKKPQMNECLGKGRNEKSLLFSYLLTAGESLSSDQMKDWMRFCANIIWNASEPESALELIFKLHTRANEIISYLASDDSGKDSAISQYAEEITKAQKLLSNEVKKEEIIRAESTAFADGRIDFLFFDGNWNEFTNRLNSFQTWFDENGVKKDYQVAVAKAYIKLSTLRWGQNYFFDASKDFWKTNVLAKANTDDNRCFVSRLLSATNKDDLNKIEIEEMDEFLFAIKTSLVENDWFIKWMVQQWDGAKYSLKWPNGHPCFHKYHCNNVIYWDAGGWFAEEENLIENKLNTRFFKIMHDRGVNIDDGYYSLIDADGNSIGTDFSTSYLVIWGEWYNGVNYTRFKYKDKTYYLISTGKIISSAEYYNNEWNKVGEERSIYYINDKQERDLKSEKELIDMISNIPAK